MAVHLHLPRTRRDGASHTCLRALGREPNRRNPTGYRLDRGFDPPTTSASATVLRHLAPPLALLSHFVARPSQVKSRCTPDRHLLALKRLGDGVERPGRSPQLVGRAERRFAPLSAPYARAPLSSLPAHHSSCPLVALSSPLAAHPDLSRPPPHSQVLTVAGADARPARPAARRAQSAARRAHAAACVEVGKRAAAADGRPSPPTLLLDGRRLQHGRARGARVARGGRLGAAGEAAGAPWAVCACVRVCQCVGGHLALGQCSARWRRTRASSAARCGARRERRTCACGTTSPF